MSFAQRQKRNIKSVKAGPQHNFFFFAEYELTALAEYKPIHGVDCTYNTVCIKFSTHTASVFQDIF